MIVSRALKLRHISYLKTWEESLPSLSWCLYGRPPPTPLCSDPTLRSLLVWFRLCSVGFLLVPMGFLCHTIWIYITWNLMCMCILERHLETHYRPLHLEYGDRRSRWIGCRLPCGYKLVSCGFSGSTVYSCCDLSVWCQEKNTHFNPVLTAALTKNKPVQYMIVSI